jgi:hypothetical protein
MLNMKKFSIVLLVTMFLVNTTVVSAWAKPCMMNDIKTIEMDSHSTINAEPCDMSNKSEKQNLADCCDGFCLCLHTSVSQTILPINSANFPDLALLADSYNQSDERISSLNHSPPSPPPKFNS